MTTSVTGITNTTPNSCVPLTCDCATMWALATQFAYLRLSNKNTQTGQYRVIDAYNVRARRIAATYARFYLELEDGCDPRKKGRFYWMAMGAFASKTVACTFEAPQLHANPIVKTVIEGLAKGNFWLFIDIAATHWYWAHDPDDFLKCAHHRKVVSTTGTTPVTQNMKKLNWFAEATQTLNHLNIEQTSLDPETKKPKPHVMRQAFKKMLEIETVEAKYRPKSQKEHLLLIAEHEQGNVLQPLIYDDPDFADWIRWQRKPVLKQLSPDLKLVFTHACSTDNPDLESEAFEDTKVEVYSSRMIWINSAVKKFHNLMITKAQFMESELQRMATWVSMPDTTILPNEEMPS